MKNWLRKRNENGRYREYNGRRDKRKNDENKLWLGKMKRKEKKKRVKSGNKRILILFD